MRTSHSRFETVRVRSRKLAVAPDTVVHEPPTDLCRSSYADCAEESTGLCVHERRTASPLGRTPPFGLSEVGAFGGAMSCTVFDGAENGPLSAPTFPRTVYVCGTPALGDTCVHGRATLVATVVAPSTTSNEVAKGGTPPAVTTMSPPERAAVAPVGAAGVVKATPSGDHPD